MIVVEDPHRGHQRMVGGLQPPQVRGGDRVHRPRADGVVSPQQLSREEIQALKFAAHRQLVRWAKSRPLAPRQQARRDALIRAARTLEGPAFADGCELRPIGGA